MNSKELAEGAFYLSLLALALAIASYAQGFREETPKNQEEQKQECYLAETFFQDARGHFHLKVSKEECSSLPFQEPSATL